MSPRIDGLWTGICGLISKDTEKNEFRLIYYRTEFYLTNCLV
jgi:hypothetical protein